MSEPIDEAVDAFKRYCSHDEQAARSLFQLYWRRLTALVRSRMSPKLARRIDAEDVVQSAYRTFFIRARDAKFEIEDGGDLWRLLAAIAMNKLGKQITRNQASKRDMRVEESVSAVLPMTDPQPRAELSPDDEVALDEELDMLLAAFNETQQQMIEMRLAGHKLEEIAEETGRSERTVRRVLDVVKEQLQKRLFELDRL